MHNSKFFCKLNDKWWVNISKHGMIPPNQSLRTRTMPILVHLWLIHQKQTVIFNCLLQFAGQQPCRISTYIFPFCKCEQNSTFFLLFVFFYQLVHILYHLLPALHFKHPDKRTIYKHAGHNAYKLKHYSFPRTSCLISTQKNWRCPLHRCYHMWNNVKIHCRICNQEIQNRNYQKWYKKDRIQNDRNSKQRNLTDIKQNCWCRHTRNIPQTLRLRKQQNRDYKADHHAGSPHDYEHILKRLAEYTNRYI